MTATFYIAASVCVIVLCAVSYALGHRDGKADGYAEHDEFCRRRCAR